MVGGTGLIKCSKEDFEKLKKKVSAHYYKKLLITTKNFLLESISP